MTEAKILLEERGIRPTQQRMAVLRYLRDNRNHPTVDTIYSSLHDRMPSLSRTTLYNTLRLLSSAGLALSLTIEGDEIRFDGDTSDHGHCKCRRCGGVFDFPLPETLPLDLPDGFLGESVHIYAWGTCRRCASLS